MVVVGGGGDGGGSGGGSRYQGVRRAATVPSVTFVRFGSPVRLCRPFPRHQPSRDRAFWALVVSLLAGGVIFSFSTPVELGPRMRGCLTTTHLPCDKRLAPHCSEMSKMIRPRKPRSPAISSVGTRSKVYNMKEMILDSKRERLGHLESQAFKSLKYAVENMNHPVFPCALIAGDMVILELLHRLGYLASGEVQVMFVDTFHLFNETIDFMKATEDHYGFKANWFHAEGFENKAEIEEKYGIDFWKDDLKLYDSICKVEPYWRGLKTLEADVVINGRRRDHGFDRAFIDVYEPGGEIDKINTLAYWTFEDVWDYIQDEGIAYHPLHDQGYPSIGDEKDTIPVPKEKWFEYAGERLGRFNGLTNDDGSTKTECGIHARPSAEETRDEDGGGNGSSSSAASDTGGFTFEIL